MKLTLGIDASNLRNGGGVTHLIEVLKAYDIKPNGIVRVIVWGSAKTLQQLPTSNFIEFRPVFLLNKGLLYRLFWQRFQLLKELKKERCDLLFVPGGNCLCGFQPFVTMSRNMLPFEDSESSRYGLSLARLRLWILRYSQLNTFNRAQGLIYLSKYAKNSIRKYRKSSRPMAVIIPHGVSQRFRFNKKKQLSISEFTKENPMRLLYVSPVEPYKHHCKVVEAITKLYEKGLPIRMSFIGGGYKKTVNQLNRLIATKDPNGLYLNYHGALPYQDLHEHYRCSDMFVFASTCENLPNTLLEAMSAGLPIACSNKGVMPEILGCAGLYFDSENVESIMACLEKLINDKILRERFIGLAYEQVRECSWDICAEKTFDFLLKVYKSTTITN